MPAQGPLMIVATEALTPPKVRIGHIGGNFTLPRTVPLASLIAGACGALVGFLFALVVDPGLTFMVFGIVIGGAAGVAAVTMSPLKGESLSRWLGLQLRTRRQRIKLEGDVVQLAVGIALLKSATVGEVRLTPGAVNVRPSQYDERGVAISQQDILRTVLDTAGVTSMAETVMSDAVYLDEVERHATTNPFRRRSRPRGSEAPAPAARPLSWDSTPTYEAVLAQHPSESSSLVTAPPSTAVSSLEELYSPPVALPTPFAVPPAAVTIAEPVEDLPEVEGIADWFGDPLESLFAAPSAPEPAPTASPEASSLASIFAVVEKKVATTGWIAPDTATADVIPPGWTKPTQRFTD